MILNTSNVRISNNDNDNNNNKNNNHNKSMNNIFFLSSSAPWQDMPYHVIPFGQKYKKEQLLMSP